MRKATKEDYRYINSHFSISGWSVFHEDSDSVLKSADIEGVARYLFKEYPEEVIKIMKKIKDIEDGDNMLETLISECDYVFDDYENGMYYVIA